MGGSRDYIFIDKYLLNQGSSYKMVYILDGVLTPYLTLKSNEYQLHMVRFASNVIQKLCDLLGGSGGH